MEFKLHDEVTVKGQNVGKPQNRLMVVLIDKDGIWLSQRKPNGRYKAWHGPYKPHQLEKKSIQQEPKAIQQTLV